MSITKNYVKIKYNAEVIMLLPKQCNYKHKEKKCCHCLDIDSLTTGLS